jgi:hypothetical protein
MKQDATQARVGESTEPNTEALACPGDSYRRRAWCSGCKSWEWPSQHPVDRPLVYKPLDRRTRCAE